MAIKLLDQVTGDLLRKFGMGNHKPGSGSAAAFQGLISAELVKTVIAQTNDEKRRHRYEAYLPEMLKMLAEIEEDIIPELERLFQEDSDQFDKAIILRRSRDAELDEEKRAKLAASALKELVPSTEMPVEIANLCVPLAGYAAYVFRHGFGAVRGDSAVALNGAIAAIGGCLAIIELNLLSFEWNDWANEITLEVKRLKGEHDRLQKEASNCLAILENANKAKRQVKFTQVVGDFRSGRWEDIKLSDGGIEDLARQLQNALWLYRDLLWMNNTPNSHLEILKPEVALQKLMGFEFDLASLGMHVVDSVGFVIAGEIDKEKKSVLVNRDLPLETRNFTAAHELGHALLHKEMVLHRDRPLDGTSFRNPDYREVQANRFAAYFLMPSNRL